MDAPRQRGGPGPGLGRDMSRAEKFEEEKRRIVESCFNKKDTDGSILETYITHIRITEYASHPTSPPPPESRRESEKPRVIIVSVRKSGRVRMHKSKENANGTFSIGKTWDLNELTAIESFTASTVEPQKRQWAGDTGFIVNIGKPYYWQAHADKEKKFFIASLIKIYGKYTGGGQPELRGFDPREQDQVLGSRKPPPPRQPPPPYDAGLPRPEQTGTPPRPSPIPPRPDAKVPIPSSRPDGLPPPRAPSRPPSRPDSRPQSRSRPEPKPLWVESSPAQTTPASFPSPRPSQQPSTPSIRNFGPPNGNSSPSPSVESGRISNQPPALRKLASNKSQDSLAASFTTAKSDDAGSIPPRSRGGISGSGPPGRLGDPPDMPPSQVDLPDRKRPPMDPLRPQGATDNDLVPAPLMSQGSRREPPPRSSERIVARNDLGESRPESSRTEKSDLASEPAKEVSTIMDNSLNGTTDASISENPAPEASSTGSPNEEETRPGLGPMIKAKRSQQKLAGTLWKAASAAGTFKPRPGGAGERLREAAKKAIAEGPDGITSVVPAPPRPTPQAEVSKPVEPTQKSDDKPVSVPEVKITVPSSSQPTSLEITPKEVQMKQLEETRKKEEAQRIAITGNDTKYFSALGVDTTLLADTAMEFARWLDHFGWVPGNQMRSRNYDEMKLDIERELNKAQAGGWVARFQEEDERVDAIKTGLDAAITECDELDNLLTLYSVELSTLSDDIAYIEAQGQGLQVQAANQKLLRNELESLLDICAITADDLQPLKTAPLETASGLEEIEGALVTLYKAMMKIDPSVAGPDMRKSEDTSMNEQQTSLNPDYGKMRIVQEKKEMYLSETKFFLNRLGGFMSRQFDKAIQETKSAIAGALSKKVDPRNHDAGRALLWQYHPLILYAREVNLGEWDRYLHIYQEKNNPLYRSQFKDILEVWKRNARKPASEESVLLFTAQIEKQQEGTMATARRVTVKRSQTLARTLGRPLGEGSKTNSEKGQDGRSHPYEIFAGVMDDLLPLVAIEQNFIVDFFHATTLETADFPDLVAMTRPRDRQGGDLKRHRLMEPDRDLARRVTRAMEAIFIFLEQDLQNLILWVLAQDPLQGVGILAVLERKQVEMTSSNQDFLNNVLQKLNGTLESRFSKFVEEQIRAIEDTKVKIKKRKGVISFMRVFPNFSAAVENMLSMTDTASSVRRAVDREYERIIKSMFDSLKVIARENPATLTSSGADPEDKEALNYHILLIENMNHFSEELNTHGLEVLEDWKEAAASEMAEHMGLYLNAVMRRPLGKLLEYLENLEAQIASGKTITIIAAQPSNSKATFNKILSAYDGREVRKGIEALRKRVEKHFGDADDPSLSRELVNRVLRECEKFYNEVEVRISTITTTVYGGDVLFEWPRADVKIAFSTTGR
ncbi:exocyst complex component Sec3-domain-containing protein [Xylaria bambusicola]|uniref:exocyst complex component Sec3-domain-containing protein n=1 Tax=Xylaria bambusicola TaxID=326684 RepID=UPI0020077A38|nr:exocyst complex component Sec3-domain-containing protein [Xylaria bambusicola]KAI0506084.1 exocyst complex component Sec3-domain-containing protein [Xylaria bambusicola]